MHFSILHGQLSFIDHNLSNTQNCRFNGSSDQHACAGQGTTHSQVYSSGELNGKVAKSRNCVGSE